MSNTSSWPRKLIDKYRDINVEGNWWTDEIISNFKTDLGEIGICVEHVYWSGFWSQGDGACFEGYVYDWGKYLEHLKLTDPILVSVAKDYWMFSCKQLGHYYHAKSVSYNDEVWRPRNPYNFPRRDDDDEDTFRAAVWDATMDQHDLLAICSRIQEDFESHMKSLYEQLEKEYEYLTSDEAVIEWMQANDIDSNELTEQD